MNTKFLYTGLLFLLIIPTGFWVSRSGKPYHVGIFTIHKLIGVALGLTLILTVARMHKANPLHSLEIVAVVITVLIFALLIAAGALLSIQAEGGLTSASQRLLTTLSLVHKIFPYLAVVSTGVTLYLLFYRKG